MKENLRWPGCFLLRNGSKHIMMLKEQLSAIDRLHAWTNNAKIQNVPWELKDLE